MNVGIDSMAAAVQDSRIHNGPSGAMVRRAAINDPCSSALTDSLWCCNDDDEHNVDNSASQSRGDLLLDYKQEYCNEEE